MRRREWVGLACLAGALASCGETVTGSDQWRYDQDLTLRVVVTSSGGLLGEERYRVWARYKHSDDLIFNGFNGTNFAVKRVGKSVAIRFCDGMIDSASPIWLDEPRNELIHVKLITDCTFKHPR